MKNVRILTLAWDWGIDDLRDLCLPSILQPGNIPWLANNGFHVTLTTYTIARDAERLREVLATAFERVQFPREMISIGINQADLPAGASGEMKRLAFSAECERAIAESAPVMMLAADAFYGDGSLRNITLCTQRPRSATGTLYTRVKREPFLHLLRAYSNAFPGRPVSNARLVDMALRTELESIARSHVEADRNASFLTSASFRTLSGDLDCAIYHLPSPAMFWPEISDLQFFAGWCYGMFEALDHMWPQKLIAEGRWQYIPSSDLFFLAELNSETVEQQHTLEEQDGRRHNERFVIEVPSTLMSEMVVATLRREPYLSGAGSSA